MMKPTVRLRFIKAPGGLVLQQEWIDDDPIDEGAIRYQWRDVRTEDAPQASGVARGSVEST